MRILAREAVNDWFAGYPTSAKDYVQYDGRELFFAHPEADCIDLKYPAKLERLPFFARLLATVGYDSQNFEGALLWFTTWGVWNSIDEAAGYQIIEAMHRAAGQPASFEAAPGHLFRSDELADAVAMLLQPMVFGWDAYYLPRWSYGTDEFFVHISHDSFVSIVTRTAIFHDKVFDLLKEIDLNPQTGGDIQRNRFCRSN